MISGSPTEVDAVFDAIAGSAAVLTSADVGGVLRTDGRQFSLAALHGADPARVDAIKHLIARAVDSESFGGRVILSRTILHVADMEALPSAPPPRSNSPGAQEREGQPAASQAESGARADTPMATLSVLPMEIQIGDRFTDEEGDWEVVSRPATLHGAKSLRARVQHPGQPGQSGTWRGQRM